MMVDDCFVKKIRSRKRGLSHLCMRVGLEMAALISLPLLLVLVPRYSLSWWPAPDEEFSVASIKLISIAFLGIHTIVVAPRWAFKANGIFMLFSGGLLLTYVIIKHLPSTECAKYAICAWPNMRYSLLIVTIVTFMYMPMFLLENAAILRKSEDNIEEKLFIEAFIFGVNIPSILSFTAIIVIYIFALRDNSEIFLGGATALLVFSSSASAICIDHYAKPFRNEKGDAGPKVA